ncbi:polysaccharide biosynthesis tyrosine autokinase [Actinomycetaceae bacterium L2_0104]
MDIDKDLNIVELRDLLLILRRSRILILATTLIAIALAAVWSLTRTPQYEATTELFVSVRSGDVSAEDITKGSALARRVVASYVPIANRSIVMDRVVRELGLPQSGEELAKRVYADSPANTALITIHATDPDPEQAALLANTTSEVFADVIANDLELAPSLPSAGVQLVPVQAAEEPQEAVSPRHVRNLALGALTGIALGFGLAIVRSALDSRIRTSSDVAVVTGLPVLGVIGRDGGAGVRPLVAVQDPGSPLVEAYRVLRTNLRYVDVGDGLTSVVVTSAGPGEGKSTTAANLAIVMADAGRRVALVDADLRKPSVAGKLGVEGGVGLSDVLIGQVSLEGALQQWGKNQLFVLPAGRVPPNPSELLGSSAMEKVLEALSGVFDYVIIDAPPALVVTDAAVLSRSTGGVLVVAASGRVGRVELGGAVESLRKVGGKVVGVVVTMVPTKGPDTYATFSHLAASQTRVPDSENTSAPQG